MNNNLSSFDEVIKIADRFSAIIETKNEFPDSILKIKDWKGLIFDSYHYFNNDTFSVFKNFILELAKDNFIYIFPKLSISEIENMKREIKLDELDFFKIDFPVKFGVFEGKQESIIPAFENTFIVGNSMDWILYNVYALDILIFFYNPKIEHLVLKNLHSIALTKNDQGEIIKLINIMIQDKFIENYIQQFNNNYTPFLL